MKKITFLFIFTFALISLVFGKQVDEQTAKVVARNFLTHASNTGQLYQISNLSIVLPANPATLISQTGKPENPLFYVFNLNSTGGFVIIAGDDAVTPVLGFSFESSFSYEKLPPNVESWLRGYENEIRAAVEQHLKATPSIESDWSSLVNGTLVQSPLKGVRGVNPLIQTKWDQSPFYNDLCPYDSQYGEKTVTGCVATAMAQVMKFYNYPAGGIGFHSYNHPKYGTLSANFAGTNYAWTSMPNSVNAANTAVATLMYHCGISVDMQYNVGSVGGSGAYVINSGSPVTNTAEFALKSYFGYANTLQGLDRPNYTDAQWIALLKAELNAGRPMVYAGSGTGGGHCFVCDGYNDSDYFHFNWGWSGSYDGYFQINALNPGGTGTGGGTGGYNNGQEAITGIRPPMATGGGSSYYRLALNAPVISLKDTIYYEDSLVFHTDVLNNGHVTFNGDLSAALFDSNDVFIDFVDVVKGITLEPGFHLPNGVTFTNPGMPVLLPGTYYVGILYSAGDTNWIDVGDTLSYINYPEIEVINPNDIEMNAPMSLTPGTILTQGQPVTVRLEIFNYGAEAFNGILDLSLYDVDGEYMNSIEEKKNFLLQPNTGTNGLTFNTSSINTEPGDYLLALWYLPNGSEDWELVGSTDYNNPLQVQVVGEPLVADIYEPNNTPPQSYQLPVTFTGNTAEVKTTGANCHLGNDYDLYKIVLPAGFSYMIYTGLDDLESDSTQTFTLDGIWSYSTDGNNWSSTYDDIMPGTIVMHDGGTLSIFISPKYTGSTGTYQLNVRINKNPLGIADGDPGRSLLIYPNPAREMLFVESQAPEVKIRRCIISSMDGKELMHVETGTGSGAVQIPLNDISDGIYFLRAVTSTGTMNRKILIRK